MASSSIDKSVHFLHACKLAGIRIDLQTDIVEPRLENRLQADESFVGELGLPVPPSFVFLLA